MFGQMVEDLGFGSLTRLVGDKSCPCGIDFGPVEMADSTSVSCAHCSPTDRGVVGTSDVAIVVHREVTGRSRCCSTRTTVPKTSLLLRSLQSSTRVPVVRRSRRHSSSIVCVKSTHEHLRGTHVESAPLLALYNGQNKLHWPIDVV